MSLLKQKHLQDEEAAYAWVEARIWPEGPVCPHCGEKERISKMQGKATRIGLYKCYACRKQFNVKVGTIFESSHVQMHIWLQAFYLIAGSKKGISSNQLHRTLGVTLKTAWFMSHRIREAMRTGSLATPLGRRRQDCRVLRNLHRQEGRRSEAKGRSRLRSQAGGSQLGRARRRCPQFSD